jgi:hypothetical protein
MSCPDCGAPVAAAARFCRGCGRAVEATRAAPAARVPAPPTEVRPAPVPPSAPPPRRPAEQPLGVPPGGRGWRVAGVVALWFVLAGVAGGTAYLLTRGDDSQPQGLEVEQAAGSPEGEAGTPGEVAGVPSGEGSFATGVTPTERGFPSDSKAVMRAEIEELLREFHVAVAERDFQYAWSLLTVRKQQQEAREKSYSSWKEAQATLAPYLEPYGIHVDIDGLEGDGVARVLVTGMGWTNPDSPCAEWSGLTWVRHEAGAWQYDPGYSTTEQRRRNWENRSDELLGVGC